MESQTAGIDRCLYDDEISKRKLLDAVRNGDIKTAKDLIAKGVDVNLILDDSPLNAAISLRRMDMLELLLSQPNVNLNIQTPKWQNIVPPLLCNLFYRRGHGTEVEDEFVLRLIRAGCDINVTDTLNRTPLHLSMLRSTITVAHELIKQGADINAQCSQYRTALHYAIDNQNLEAVCILLYYNADVYIKCYRGGRHDTTPLCYALYLEHFEIAEILINYYDVNYIFSNIEAIRAFLRYTCGEEFKAAWPKLDPKLVLDMCPSFFEAYICSCRYSTSDWIECLYLILNSDIALDMIECYSLNVFVEYEFMLNLQDSFLKDLQDSMCRRNVQPEDRLGIIYTVLSLGIKLHKHDINKAITVYGLSKDLEALIYGTYIRNPLTLIPKTFGSKSFIYPPHFYAIDMETDYSNETVLWLFKSMIGFLEQLSPHPKGVDQQEQIFVSALKYFSFSANTKWHLVKHLAYEPTYAYAVMFEKCLENIPEFPSLMELSRNTVHNFLIQTFKFQQPYQFQDLVNKLNIPTRIKQVLLFKATIY